MAPSPSSSVDSGQPKTWRCGTLLYTRAGLVSLFFWILWGDFCLNLMEAVVPIVVPLQLKALSAPNLLMAVITSTIPAFLNMTVCPWVSYTSDRSRSRFGRRIPFLLWPTPFICLFLLLLGFSPELGASLHRALFANASWMTVGAATIVVIGVLMVLYTFFNMFVMSIFWYLFNDVVPIELMGRFLALMRMVGTAAGALFSYFVFPHAETHARLIFLGAAAIYGTAFLLMCWKVKEGKYPPPPTTVDQRQGVWSNIKTYATECFTHRYYLLYFLANACFAVGVVNPGGFSIFFSREIGLTLEQLGKVGGISGLVIMLLIYPCGILVDRIHPLRIAILARFLMVLLNSVNLIFLFWNFTPKTVFLIFLATNAAYLPMCAMLNAADSLMHMRIFPKERYGQFCSAQAMLSAAGCMVGGLVLGGSLDLLKHLHHGSDFAYRYFPIWGQIFQTVALFLYYLLYREWKRLGGEHSKPPAV